MIHVGLDLQHRTSYVRAMTEDGQLLPGRRIHHARIEELWQYLGQFGRRFSKALGGLSIRWVVEVVGAGGDSPAPGPSS